MTILHSHSIPQLTDNLRTVLAEAKGHPHSVDLGLGYFYLSGFAPEGRRALNGR
jgi:hypothetical protein